MDKKRFLKYEQLRPEVGGGGMGTQTIVKKSLKRPNAFLYKGLLGSELLCFQKQIHQDASSLSEETQKVADFSISSCGLLSFNSCI